MPTCTSWPSGSRSSCSTAGWRGCPAWSPTRRTAAGRSSSTSRRSATRRSPTWGGRGPPGAPGPRSIAYLAGPSAAWSDGERWRALSVAAQAAGVAVVRCGPFPPTLDGGPAAADIGLSTGATALVAFNDLLAIGVLRRLADRGVDVPGRVSVVGFDDIFGADFCHPPLTTVAGPVEEAGRALVDVLLADRAVAPTMTLPTHLRIRASTGPPPPPGSGA